MGEELREWVAERRWEERMPVISNLILPVSSPERVVRLRHSRPIEAPFVRAFALAASHSRGAHSAAEAEKHLDYDGLPG
jgi:hypothetical protein